MLIITNKQIRMFDEYMLRQFAERIIKYLKNHFVQNVSKFENEELISLIVRAINKAKQYQLSTEWDICRFAQYQFLCGENFEQKTSGEWAIKILKNANLSEKTKMDRMDYHYFYFVAK